MNIKKKLLALTAALAIFASFAGCSDKDDSSSEKNDNNSAAAEEATLSSEEYEQVAKHNLSIEPFIPNNGDVQQDAVEGDDSNNDSPAGDNNNTVDNNADNNNVNDNKTDDNNSSPAQNENIYVVEDNDPGKNNADLPGKTGLEIHNGTRATMQAWWMDISKSQDYIFNGEYLVAEFKIKEGTADGIYPITINHADFANWNSQTVEFDTVDGAVVVGGEAEENKFNDGDAPQLMVTNVSGKAGDTVKVAINIQNNPGVVANILRFSYNSDVLEFVSAGEGADFNGKFN